MDADAQVGSVTVFGGTGFLGSEIVRRLSAANIDIFVAVRHLTSAVSRPGETTAGQIQEVYADVRDETSVGLAIANSEAVVNAVGLYAEAGEESFEAVHERGALNVAHQCKRMRIGHLIHISGIGADPYSKSRYVRSRGMGELLVRDVFSSATILRPSVVFGPNDKFLNTLANVARFSPVLPVFGRGQTRLQPVYAGDVGEATLNALRQPAARGKIYELGGPRIYSYRALLKLVLAQSKRRRLLVPVPFAIWDLLAASASFLAHPPLTEAQVTLMRSDNVTAKSALSLDDLGVAPTALEDVLAEYAF